MVDLMVYYISSTSIYQYHGSVMGFEMSGCRQRKGFLGWFETGVKGFPLLHRVV